jgi:hypothetical protein
MIWRPLPTLPNRLLPRRTRKVFFKSSAFFPLCPTGFQVHLPRHQTTAGPYASLNLNLVKVNFKSRR